MRVACIAAGAAGMYCGSCIHDNTLAAALQRLGTDVVLVPTYTPLRTDEEDVSIDRVFFGGINVYLQQKSALFRHTPAVIDRIFDRPRLLNGLSRFSASTSAADLGALTLSVLEGEQGRQRKELNKLVDWLAGDFKPDLVQLPNSLFLGFARELKRRLGVPVICGLQGEDLFVDGLIEPYKSQVLQLLRQRAADVDGFVAPCDYYSDYMARLLDVPPERVHVVHLGIALQGYGDPVDKADGSFHIGYLARICPEKGLHLLIDAFIDLRTRLKNRKPTLAIAGYLGLADRGYFQDLMSRLRERGLADAVVYQGEVTREEKIAFLQRLDVLSVPTTYADPKGLFVLESLAAGVPVAQPRHGAFPELIAATGGGVLVDPGSASAVAEALAQLADHPQRRLELGSAGQRAVRDRFDDNTMARNTLTVYKRYSAKE
jgi:glycosyltransferase involved in cell wall biosynthesis